jgi:hypothetical protein
LRQPVEHKIGANKTGAACHQNHLFFLVKPPAK